MTCVCARARLLRSTGARAGVLEPPPPRPRPDLGDQNTSAAVFVFAMVRFRGSRLPTQQLLHATRDRREAAGVLPAPVRNLDF